VNGYDQWSLLRKRGSILLKLNAGESHTVLFPVTSWVVAYLGCPQVNPHDGVVPEAGVSDKTTTRNQLTFVAKQHPSQKVDP
jgi:hypothetical protein